VSDRIFWWGFLPFKQAALKGRNIPAQGNALGTGLPVEEALKGRNIELLKFLRG